MAKLFFTYGQMESLKTGLLLMTRHNYMQGGSRVLVAKPAADTRADRRIFSRAVEGCDADIIITPDMNVRSEVHRIMKLGGPAVKAFLVDEAQFLAPKQVAQMAKLAVIDGVPALAYGLRADFRGNLFPGSAALFALAHETRESITMCAHGGGCEHKAVLNARLVDGTYVREGAQVAIDGATGDKGVVTYSSLCFEHYLEDVGPIYDDE